MSTVRKAGRVGLAVLGSRVLGLVREMVFAHLYGASMAGDAFRLAFRIPNLLRDLFAEGALSTAFVTTFTKTLEKDGEARAWRLANLVITLQFVVLGVIVVAGVLGASGVVSFFDLANVLARKATVPMSPEKRELVESLTRIMFPFILLVSAAAVWMGLLNARGRFGLPAAASIFFNLGSIVTGLLAAWLIDPSFGVGSIYGMAVGVLAGGALQWWIQVPAARREGFRLRPAWDMKDPRLREVLGLLGPAVIGASAVQVNVLINASFAASLGDGPVSWLEYAFRLMQFPIGLLGVAIATVTLPLVSRHAAMDDMGKFRSNLAHSTRLAFTLTLPAAVGLAVLAEPLVALLYQRGRFSAADTQSTALALRAYAIGLAGYASIKVVAPAFAAIGKAGIPSRVSIIGIVINFLLNLAFVRMTPLRHAGLALSTSLVALVNFGQLALAMRRHCGGFELRALGVTLLKAGAASAVMALAVWGFLRVTPHWGVAFWGRLAQVGLGAGIGMIVYAGMAFMLRVPEAREVAEALARRLRRRAGGG
jgi:putative peptidoglycan lipid II flippase